MILRQPGVTAGRASTTRTLGIVAAATFLLGAVTVSAWGGDAGPSLARSVTGVTWCKQTNGLMRQVWSRTACAAGESKYSLVVGAAAAGPRGLPGATGPQGPAGARGATGPAGVPGLTGAPGAAGPAGPVGATGGTGPAGGSGTTGTTGATGATGATGPSDPYAASLLSANLVNGTPSNLMSVTVPAGSYLVSFTGYGSGATTDGQLVCQVQTANTYASFVQPVQIIGIDATPAGANPELAMNGVLVSGVGQTLTARCALTGTAAGASIVNARLTAMQVGQVH